MLNGRLFPMRLTTSVVVSMLFMVSPIHAQDQSQVAMRRQELAQAKDDTARAIAMSEIGFNLIYALPDSARSYLQQAMDLAERIRSPKALATTQANMAWYATKTGDDVGSVALCRSALGFAQQAKDKRLIATIVSIQAALAEQHGDVATALSLHRTVLQQWESLGEDAPAASALYNIGRLYVEMGEYARARDLFTQALEVQTRIGNTNSQGNCLLMIGNTWKREGDPAKAMELYDRAFAIFQGLVNQRGMGLVEENRGALHAPFEPTRALQHFERALDHYAAMGDAEDRGYILIEMAKVLLTTGDLQKAERALNEGHLLLREIGDTDLTMEYELLWAELYTKLGKSDQALAHYRVHMAFKDSARSTVARNELMRLRAEFETERAEKDNALLRAKDLETTERLRARNLQLYGSLALAALALGAVVLVWRNLQQRRQHQVVLEGLNSELHEQKARIEEINGLLRLKVLRTQMDPHFIHNCLNAIRALSLKGEHERAEEYLEGFARILRNVLEHSVRDRIALDEEIAFLNDYVRLEQLRLGNDLTWSITADDTLLDEELQVPSLLVQPFVENAIWHGLAPKNGPKRLDVHFYTSGGVVTCRVQDNGVGRAEKAPTPGRTSLGLKLTGERLELLTERMRSAGGFRVEDLKDEDGAPAGTLVELRLAV